MPAPNLSISTILILYLIFFTAYILGTIPGKSVKRYFITLLTTSAWVIGIIFILGYFSVVTVTWQ